MKKKLVLAVSAIIMILLISAKLMLNKSEVDTKNKISDLNFKTVSVNITNAVRQERTMKLTLVGTTAAQSEVLVQSQGNGEIMKMNSDIGDYVSRGQVLARIDDRLAVLALERAKLTLSRAEDEYNKEKNLYSGKATTENNLRDKKIDQENARIAVEQAQKQLEFMTVKSPINGRIVEKQVQQGSLVNTGSPVVRIVDISGLKITASVSEQDAYRIRNGMGVRVTTSVYPGAVYNGKVSFISSKGDQAHNYPVEVSVSNNVSSPLKAGTFVTIEFDMGSKQNVLVIPREALVNSIKDARVFCVKNGRAYLRTVIIGNDFGDYLEVLGGLSEGDAVVTAGQINLVDGSRVVSINK